MVIKVVGCLGDGLCFRKVNQEFTVVWQSLCGDLRFVVMLIAKVTWVQSEGGKGESL